MRLGGCRYPNNGKANLPMSSNDRQHPTSDPTSGSNNVTVDGITFRNVRTTPLAFDLDVARKLGLAKVYDIRKLINRWKNSLGEVFATESKTSSRGGRPGWDYWLTEAQVLFIAAKSDTPKAVEITKEMIRIFLLFKNGQASPGISEERLVELIVTTLATALPPILLRVVAPIYERLDRLEARMNTMTQDVGVIGSAAGKRIRTQLKIYAALMGETAEERREWYGEGQMTLRGELGFSGRSMSWDRLPTYQHADAQLKLLQMIELARKVAAKRGRDRQQVIPFPRAVEPPKKGSGKAG